MNLLFYFENQINPMRGGTERVADTIAHAMRDKGHKIYYLSRRHIEGEYDVECFFLPDEIGNTQRNINYINELILQKNIDIVINEGGNTDDVYMFSKEHIKKAKVINHLHFSPYGSFKYYYKGISMHIFCKNGIINLLKWIKTPYNKYYHLKNTIRRYRYMIDNSDKVITLSPSYSKDLADIAGTNVNDRITAIFNPTCFSDIKVDIHNKENVILSVGRLVYSPKRVDLLLKVWKKASTNMPGWKLQILGGGPDENRLKSIVIKEKIRNVEFLGFQNPEKYYKKAKVLCMTSLFEGTPMVITEAMQYGCVPVVYNTFSAISDMIENEKNGYIVPPFNKDEYANKLITLADKEHFTNLSEYAMNSLDKFNYNNIMNQWEELLNSF